MCMGQANPRSVGACLGFLSPLCASPRSLEHRWNRWGGKDEGTRLCWSRVFRLPGLLDLRLLPPVPLASGRHAETLPCRSLCLCQRLPFPRPPA